MYMDFKKITVVGAGYVGLITGLCLAKVGHNVKILENSNEKIEKLKKRISPIKEAKVGEFLSDKSLKIEFYDDQYLAYSNTDIIILCVGTPQKKDGSANLKFIYDACEKIVNYITKDCIVIIKSTVPVGTNDLIDSYFKSKNINYNITIVSNPEFLSQGTAIYDTFNASRIVVGCNDDYSKEVMKQLYKPFTDSPYNIPLLIMDRKSAELVKYASNCFLALKISYINEIANLCDALDVNVDNVIDGMKYDTRIGNQFLRPGIGYGGSCFPKDTNALLDVAKHNNIELKTIDACIQVNENQKLKLIEKMLSNDVSLNGINIGILGLSFKKNTDDIRESPAIDNIEYLLEKNAYITVFDTMSVDNIKKVFGEKINYANDLDDLLNKKDIVLILNDNYNLENLTIKKIKQLMKSPIIYDGRNCFDPKIMKQNGIKYYSIGRGV